jgi:hypothetical protein
MHGFSRLLAAVAASAIALVAAGAATAASAPKVYVNAELTSAGCSFTGFFVIVQFEAPPSQLAANKPGGATLTIGRTKYRLRYADSSTNVDGKYPLYRFNFLRASTSTVSGDIGRLATVTFKTHSGHWETLHARVHKLRCGG